MASALEEAFYRQVLDAGLPTPVREYRFCPSRRWRADFAYPGVFLLIEVEGGIYVRGRHVRGAGYDNDAEKYNTANLLGYHVLRFTPKMIKDRSALAVLKAMLEKKGEEHGEDFRVV